MTLTEITCKADFDSILNSFDGLIVVDFYADWCGPCRNIAPKFKTMAETYTNCKFLKVNVDNADDVAQACRIEAMPTFHLYKKTAKVAEVVGADAAKLEDLIKKNQ